LTQAIEDGAREEVKDAVKQAEADPEVDMKDLYTNVYVDNAKRTCYST
jgi:TPP-dependent pyruvate/acetoin dehydrogenase alpha subunit